MGRAGRRGCEALNVVVCGGQRRCLGVVAAGGGRVEGMRKLLKDVRRMDGSALGGVEGLEGAC